MPRLVPMLSVLIVFVFVLSGVAAQAPQGGGRGQAAPAKPVGVYAATAKRMIAAAEAAALAANAQVAIAIVDGNGDLVYFERMDGASARAVTSSQGKARAALLLGVPTKEAQDSIAAQAHIRFDDRGLRLPAAHDKKADLIREGPPHGMHVLTWIDTPAAIDRTLRDRPDLFDMKDINGGPPRRFTPEGATVRVPTWWALPISPDGKRVVANDEHDVAVIYAVDGGAPQPVPGLNAGDLVVQWSSDGRGLLVAHRDGLVWTVERLDIASGKRTPTMTLRAHEPAGLRLSIFAISRDAKYYVHTYARLLSDLYVVDGLK